MSERTEYELPRRSIWKGTDGLWYGHGEEGMTLAEALDASDANYRTAASTAADGLAAVRRIRVEAGLGLIAWNGLPRAFAANRALAFQVLNTVGLPSVENTWDAHCEECHDMGRRECSAHPTEAAAKAACEQWYADWLERAGLQVRR